MTYPKQIGRTVAVDNDDDFSALVPMKGRCHAAYDGATKLGTVRFKTEADATTALVTLTHGRPDVTR